MGEQVGSEAGSELGSGSDAGQGGSIGEVKAPAQAPAPVLSAPAWAWPVVLLLAVMNLLISVDLWLLAVELKGIRDQLALTPSEAGWLSTVLLLALAAAGPPFGYLADRIRRPRLLAVGFAIWSLAAVSTGMARSYEQIQVARALVGVGGAIFEVVALSILMDLFPRTARARALAVFFLAVPLGAALGLSLGAALADVTGWQTVFLAAGAPGVLLALVALMMPDPVRGLSEGVDIQRLRLHEQVGPSQEDYVDLMVNSSYTYSVFGITFSSFALAGIVYWSKSFLTVAKGLSEAQTNTPLGLTFLGAALAGTVAGGWLADWASRASPRLIFIVPGLATLGAIPFVLAAIYGRSAPLIFGGLFLAEGVMFMNVVPCYTIIASVVMPNMRAVACAVALSAVHLLGDIWSPSLMGWVADTFAHADSMATGFGHALAALGALPVAQPGSDPVNLTAGMLVVVPALLIAGVVLLAGSRHLPREMALMLAKLRAVPSRRAAQRPGAAARR
jgi:predicted MFS family arabinose efflux permease